MKYANLGRAMAGRRARASIRHQHRHCADRGRCAKAPPARVRAPGCAVAAVTMRSASDLGGQGQDLFARIPSSSRRCSSTRSTPCSPRYGTSSTGADASSTLSFAPTRCAFLAARRRGREALSARRIPASISRPPGPSACRCSAPAKGTTSDGRPTVDDRRLARSPRHVEACSHPSGRVPEHQQVRGHRAARQAPDDRLAVQLQPIERDVAPATCTLEQSLMRVRAMSRIDPPGHAARQGFAIERQQWQVLGAQRRRTPSARRCAGAPGGARIGSLSSACALPSR